MTFNNEAPTKNDLRKFSDYRELETYTDGIKHKFADGKEWIPKMKWVDKGNDCGHYIYIEKSKYGYFESLQSC